MSQEFREVGVIAAKHVLLGNGNGATAENRWIAMDGFHPRWANVW